MMDCPARTIAELEGKYFRPATVSLLIGSYVDSYFEENIYPVLTPMAMDSAAVPVDPEQNIEYRCTGAEERGFASEPCGG